MIQFYPRGLAGTIQWFRRSRSACREGTATTESLRRAVTEPEKDRTQILGRAKTGLRTERERESLGRINSLRGQTKKLETLKLSPESCGLELKGASRAKRWRLERPKPNSGNAANISRITT